ncbi:MAG: T9SS type A sorting domain-containing protein [Bacteroidota bacterium]
MKHILLFSMLILLLFTPRSNAQQLVANINQTNAGSSPARLMGNEDYGAFFARPDGGAYQLFYLPSGTDSLLQFGTDLPGDNIRDNALIGEDVYIRIYDSDQDEQIFLRADLATDSLHTFAVLGSNTSSSGSNKFTRIDGTNELLFIHRNQSYTFQLFRTDGTTAGTQLVSDLPDNEFVSQIVSQDSFAYLIYPAKFFPSEPAHIYLYDGLNVGPVNLPIGAEYGISVRRLSDKVLISGFGPDSTSHLLASPDLNQYRNLSSFPNDSNTLALNVAFLSDTHVYYTRNGGGYSHELLRTDTMASSLDTIIELNPALDSISFFDHSYDPGSGLLFYLGRDVNDGSVSLYRSDLTTAGTFPLTVVQPVGASITNISRSNLLIEGLFYFKAFRDTTGEELWVSDGTVSGTQPLLDLVPGMDDARIEDLRRMGEKLGFRANSITVGEEVFISDGSTAGTRVVLDLNEKESGSNPARFFTYQDSLFFIASNGCSGFELYKSGGTASTTKIVKDLIPGRDGYTLAKTLEVAGRAYYLAIPEASGSSYRLIETDGTETGTREIFSNIEALDIRNLSAPGRLGDDLLISAYSVPAGQQLYRYDPDSMRIDTLAFLNSSGFNSPAFCFFALSDSLSLFTPYTSLGPRLFRSDGSPQGTFMIPLMGLFDPNSISEFNISQGITYFKASANISQEYIYQTDGTVAGTQRLNSSPYDRIEDIFTYQNQAYFFAEDFSIFDLYRIDPMNGSISQTGLLNGAAEFPDNTIIKGDTIFFTAISTTHGSELWMIPGAGQVAVQVADLRMGTASSSPRELRLLDGLLYFTAEGDDGRRDLYQSDGSAQGTVLVRSISGSTTGFSPMSLIVHDSIIYFSALDSELNRELFRYNPAAPSDTSGLDDPNLNIHCDSPGGTVSIEDQVLDHAISLYPNPTADRLTVRVADNRQQLELILLSVDGRLLGKQRMSGDFLELSLGGLPPGVYTLAVIDAENGRKVVRRIVKY